MKNEEKNQPDTEISVKPVEGQPKTAFEMVNKYGTYNIQPTAESENRYPEIAQGYSRFGSHETDGENREGNKKKK